MWPVPLLDFKSSARPFAVPWVGSTPTRLRQRNQAFANLASFSHIWKEAVSLPSLAHKPTPLQAPCQASLKALIRCPWDMNGRSLLSAFLWQGQKDPRSIFSYANIFPR